MVKQADLDKITEDVTNMFTKFEEKITETWIEKIAQKITQNITAALDLKFEDRFNALNERIDTIDDTVASHAATIIKHSSKIDELTAENGTLINTIAELCIRVDKLESTHHSVPSSEEIEALSERVEERTNRQLRQTLIFKGIPEKDEKTWADTKCVLAQTIASSVGTTENNAYQVLNRVHRGRPNPQKGNQRDIYANIHNWEHCEKLVEDFRKLNISGHSNIRCEFKYGPRTTWRRNEALTRRKELKAAGTIMSGYVAYPARLMIKRPGAKKGDKYVQLEDFSKVKYAPVSTKSADAVE